MELWLGFTVRNRSWTVLSQHRGAFVTAVLSNGVEKLSVRAAVAAGSSASDRDDRNRQTAAGMRRPDAWKNT